MIPLGCLTYGVLVAVVVSTLKRLDTVRRWPKIVGAFLALAVSVWERLPRDAAMAVAVVQCTAVTLAVAVLTYEAIIQPIRQWIEKQLVGPPPPMTRNGP